MNFILQSYFKVFGIIVSVKTIIFHLFFKYIYTINTKYLYTIFLNKLCINLFTDQVVFKSHLILVDISYYHTIILGVRVAIKV